MTNIKIALIGDYSAKVTAHHAIPLALHHAVRSCETPVEEVWIGTDAIQTDVELQLSSFACCLVRSG
jgi:CTP synthase (UTP-ammonia lyase)